MSLHNSDEIEKPEMDFSAKLVSRETYKQPNFKPTKCLKFGEEKQQSDMKFAAEL